jgi:hypothetical protein
VLERSWKATHLYSSKNCSSPVPLSSCNATRFLVNHDQKSHLHAAVGYSIPCIPSASPRSSNAKAGLATLRVTSLAKRMPHLDPSWPTLPALKSFTPHHQARCRVPLTSCPLSTYSHRSRRSPSVVDWI